MECRDYKKKIPEYLAGALNVEQSAILLGHLDHCPNCRYELEQFRDLDDLVLEADVPIPVVDLSEEIMELIYAERESYQKPRAEYRRRTLSIVKDLVAAAAAAIIIFWFTGPIMADNSVRMPTEGVVKVSSSLGGAFQAYLNFPSMAMDKLSDSLNALGPDLLRGDENN